MGYVFTVGEEKEVGVELSSSDGTNFSVTATYEHKNSSGQVLASGTAQVDGKKVFVLLKPTVAGNYQQVVFTCTLTPLDAYGQPDPSKNVEKVKPAVSVIVNP